MVAMLRGGGAMLPRPRALHTKELMAASNLSGLTAYSHTMFVCLTIAGKSSNYAMMVWNETKRPKWFQSACLCSGKSKGWAVVLKLYIVRYRMSYDSTIDFASV